MCDIPLDKGIVTVKPIGALQNGQLVFEHRGSYNPGSTVIPWESEQNRQCVCM